MTETTYAALGTITKTWRDDAGVLHFEASKATGPNLDGDQQIVDQDWAKTAMEDWFRSGGNLREQHSTIAAGKALTLEPRADGQYISGKVVDPGSALKVEQDVLTGLSIGIKGGRVVKDAAAPGGRIVGGRIVEVSLVDRPCEPTCKLMLAKADDAGTLVEVEEFSDIEKNALPPLEEGGAPRYPITDVASLKKAIRAIGRVKAGDRAKVIAHIKANAKRLGRSDLIPDNWKADEPELVKDDAETTTDSGGGFTHDPETLAQIRNGLAQCMQAELDELMNGEPETWDLCNLLESLQLFLCWWNGEAAEGETAPPNETKTDTPEEPEEATVPEQQKTDTPETPGDAGATKVDGATVDIAKAVEAALAPHLAKISSLEAELVEVKKAAAPGGPSRTRSPRQAAAVARLETLQADQAYYRRLASTVNDHTLATGYRAKVKEIEAEIGKLATAD